jgi:spore coat polysaccharide biosynthesis predicted glycosyltransferase SpsG
MEAKIFSYKVAGVQLEAVNDQLKMSKSFDRKGIIAQLKEALKDENFKVDEQSFDYKIVDGQLYIEGLMVENQEKKSIGFLSGK